MGLKRTDEFRADAVRIALTNGLTRKQVAEDLDVGMSTRNKWVVAHQDTDVVSEEEREALKKGHPVPRGPKAMRFRFVEEHRGHFPAKRLWGVVGVSTRGLRAFRSRPWETRRQVEMAILEYINGFYNPHRRHSAVGWKSPVAFERTIA